MTQSVTFFVNFDFQFFLLFALQFFKSDLLEWWLTAGCVGFSNSKQ